MKDASILGNLRGMLVDEIHGLRYIFKYQVNNKVHILSSWRLVPTDKQPQGTKPTLSLRELEKLHGQDMESRLDPLARNMTVKECVERYLATKTGVKAS